MKKIIALLTALFVLGFASGPVMARSGPAPNSGDGISDGSGMEGGPNSGNGNAPGPAPSSGDGNPDGSGMDGGNAAGGGQGSASK
ncbi:MAG: hypothetical protein V2J08_09830 [Desulfotignum sp.]|jgi:hypothetical protein|nr:hypothetical protein [Desulfotignum sp.]